nr:MAG TPA: hypothetical protein [Caudoviricetes sp.]
MTRKRIKKMTHVDWHPLPEDPPKKERTYLLTIEVPCFPDLKEHCLFYKELRIGFWACGRFFAKLEDGERVTAWAFPPKPYKSEAEDE